MCFVQPLSDACANVNIEWEVVLDFKRPWSQFPKLSGEKIQELGSHDIDFLPTRNPALLENSVSVHLLSFMAKSRPSLESLSL